MAVPLCSGDGGAAGGGGDLPRVDGLARRGGPCGPGLRPCCLAGYSAAGAAVIQAACSWRMRSGVRRKSARWTAPRIADLASRSAVSDPSHRHL